MACCNSTYSASKNAFIPRTDSPPSPQASCSHSYSLRISKDCFTVESDRRGPHDPSQRGAPGKAKDKTGTSRCDRDHSQPHNLCSRSGTGASLVTPPFQHAISTALFQACFQVVLPLSVITTSTNTIQIGSDVQKDGAPNMTHLPGLSSLFPSKYQSFLMQGDTSDDAAQQHLDAAIAAAHLPNAGNPTIFDKQHEAEARPTRRRLSRSNAEVGLIQASC